MSVISIEYCHIYTNENFGNQQIQSAKILQELQNKYSQHKITKFIMVDDYSSNLPVTQLFLDELINQLKAEKCSPDIIVTESSLVECCDKVISIIKDGRLKMQLEKYIQEKGKYPCSLFIASSYLLRLGVISGQRVNVIYVNQKSLKSEKIVGILPKIYKAVENKALRIINSTGFDSLLDKIEIIYY